MIPGETNDEEWLARRAVWREDWDSVLNYVSSSHVSSKLNEILDGDHQNPHRCIVAIGVYTSFGIEFESQAYLQTTWTEAVELLYQRSPELISDALEYWELSVQRFFADKSVRLDKTDFGFK